MLDDLDSQTLRYIRTLLSCIKAHYDLSRLVKTKYSLR